MPSVGAIWCCYHVLDTHFSAVILPAANRRLAPLMVEPQAVGGLHQIQEGDCVIAVSWAMVHCRSDACGAAAGSFH
jgi:hypothetical protein